MSEFENGRSRMVNHAHFQSAAVSRLCGRVIEYVVGSSNPFSVRKRISLGTMQPNDLPACLKQPARVMVSGGIHPQIRSDETEVYHLYNSNLKKKVGYISMFYHVRIDDCVWLSIDLVLYS
ncbi:hypothetical protein niasHT_013233 [Heterodera trifolii]|uniref:Uncharacterized protein n=1 Tax=Heterodera trifolii TaxID=157864 RepID=A0ABD2KXQ1_9BILA